MFVALEFGLFFEFRRNDINKYVVPTELRILYKCFSYKHFAPLELVFWN